MDMFAIAAAVLTGSACAYAGYNYRLMMERLEGVGKRRLEVLRHSFLPETVGHYVEHKKDGERLVLYSRYQQCELATHQLINRLSIEAKTAETQLLSADQTTTPQPTGENPNIPQPPSQPKQPQLPEKTNKQLFLHQFRSYANELITANTCNSVQLIHGPIFSKDTPYKSNGETVKNIYTSTIKLGKSEEWLTDRHYTIVICNRKEGSYLNGFSYRRPFDNKIRFLNNLTAMKKLEEQTGLVFNVQGGQLTQIDYQGIAKERIVGQPKQAAKEETVTPALSQ